MGSAFKLHFIKVGVGKHAGVQIKNSLKGIEISITGEEFGTIRRVFTLAGGNMKLHRQKGVALIVVLLILAVMVTLSTQMTERTQVVFKRTAAVYYQQLFIPPWCTKL